MISHKVTHKSRRDGHFRSWCAEFDSRLSALLHSKYKTYCMDKTLAHGVPHKPSIGIEAPNQEPTLELHNRAVPSVEAHQGVNGPDTGRNSGGRWIIKK